MYWFGFDRCELVDNGVYYYVYLFNGSNIE